MAQRFNHFRHPSSINHLINSSQYNTEESPLILLTFHFVPEFYFLSQSQKSFVRNVWRFLYSSFNPSWYEFLSSGISKTFINHKIIFNLGQSYLNPTFHKYIKIKILFCKSFFRAANMIRSCLVWSKFKNKT